jgi:hypothetical protein
MSTALQKGGLLLDFLKIAHLSNAEFVIVAHALSKAHEVGFRALATLTCKGI